MNALAERLLNWGQHLERVSDRGYYWAGIWFMIIGPFLVSRVVLQWTQTHLPLFAHVAVLTIFFSLLALWAYMITGNRGKAFFKEVYKHGVKWPFLFSVSLLLFSAPCFASLTSVLSDLGHLSYEPQPTRGDLSRIQDFYLWHFLKSIPGLDVTETLLWESPYKYKDRLSGWLLLAFKVSVILPVIGSFAAWNEVRKEQKQERVETANEAKC